MRNSYCRAITRDLGGQTPANLRSPCVESASCATRGNRQLALASVINCTCSLGLHAEPTGTALIKPRSICIWAPCPAGIGIEISKYMLSVYASPARSKIRRFMSTDGEWQKELSKEISKEQYLASVVVLFLYTNRPVKHPRLNPRTGVWDLCPGCCCQIRAEPHTAG